MAPEQLDNLLERDPLYIKELWGWGAAGAVVMLLRFTVRLRIVGYKGFQGDDFFMIMVSPSTDHGYSALLLTIATGFHYGHHMPCSSCWLSRVNSEVLVGGVTILTSSPRNEYELTFNPDSNGTSIDLTENQINVLSDPEIDRLVYGSKLQEAAWYCYTAYLWCLKGALLFF
ncbi:hypothetical protein HZ326_24176 [Fusarium oxysporum f. sp. albedinis]|nr:hypothetical protein HZ326_24176 [Fusarium oxysporum f. sp. albedinis]